MVAQMLTWACHAELESIEHHTPPVIEQQDRRQLERIFNSMDVEKRGYLLADDMAGGKIQNMQTKLKNIVDADTVRAVVPKPEIYPTQFLELMCQDDHRAHEYTVQVLESNGNRLVFVLRPIVGFCGWIFLKDDVPPKEQPVRRRIDAIEAEVLRWRRVARERGLIAHLGNDVTSDIDGKIIGTTAKLHGRTEALAIGRGTVEELESAVREARGAGVNEAYVAASEEKLAAHLSAAAEEKLTATFLKRAKELE